MHINSEGTENQRENTYRIIFDESSDPAFIIDREGTILDANKAFASLFSEQFTDCADCVGLNVFGLLDTNVAEERRKHIDHAFRNGKRTFFEDERNGRFFRNTLYPIPGKDGIIENIYILAQEITETKRSETKSKIQAAFSREAMEAVPGPFVVLDARGAIINSNSHFRKIIARNEEDNLSGLNSFDLFHHDDRSFAYEKFNNILQKGTEEIGEIRIMVHGGPEYRWFRISTKRIFVDNEMFLLSTGNDINEYKKKEQELSISNEQLRFILSQSKTGSWVLDIKTNTNRWSDEIWELYGLEKKAFEPTPENWRNLIIEEDRETLEQQITENIVKGIPFKLEVRTRHSDGSLHWLLIRVFPFKDVFGNITNYIGIVIDITDLKESEQKLKESEERFRTFFEQHSAVMILFDQENGDILDANIAAEEFYGWKQNKLREMNIQEINSNSPDVSQNILDGWNNVERRNFITSHRKADGTIRDVEVFAHKIKFGSKWFVYCIIHDITERRLAEKELKKLSVALQQSPVVVSITDALGNIEYINPTFTKLTGYTFEEVKGKNPSMLQSGLMPKELYENLWKTILSGNVWHGEFHNRKKNGDLYWEDAFISAITDEKGTITSFVAVKEDITEKKKLWNELVAAKDNAEVSDRLKTAFLANMSHEIRTPMNGIIGFTELLKEPHLSGQEQQEYIALIQQSGERMMTLINDIIEISRIDAKETVLELSETPLNELLEHLYRSFITKAESKGLQLYWNPGLRDSDSIIETDAKKLELILTNLLQNALKFTHHGHISFGYTKKDDMLEFYVDDTGVGIPEDMKEKIFDRFRQVDNSLSRLHEGIGLGLSITKTYIEMLGGGIHVEPCKCGGSKFFFTLPYNPPRKYDIGHSDSEVMAISQPSQTIIIADDDQISRLLLKKVLKDENFMLIFAENGKDALELVKKHPETELVLMDVKMPDMNGCEVTRLIRQIRPELPVVVLTAFASPEEREKASDAGCDSFITKPVKKNELIDLIRTMIGK